MKCFDFSRDGLYFSLSYEGVRGWRLRISTDPDMSHTPATESLARFLGEPSTDRAEDMLTADGLTVSESGGSRVEISPLGTSMKFIAPSGKTVIELLSVSLRGGNLLLEGGRTVTAKASLGQIPVYLSEDSADADELRSIFSGLVWSRIKGMK